MKKIFNYLLSGVAILSGIATLASCDAEQTDDNKVYAKKNAKEIAVLKLGTHTSLDEIETEIKTTLEANLDSSYKISLFDCNFQMDLASQTIDGLNKDNLACVVCIATPTAVVAANKLDNIPVVFSAVSDPESAGIVGNNVTGTSDAMQLDKLVNLALDVNSNTKKLGFVFTDTEANSIANKNKLEKICNDKNIELISRSLDSVTKITDTVNAIKDKVDGFIVTDDNNVASGMATFSNICATNNIPMYCAADSEVKDGGMMGYSISYKNLGKYTANQVLEIVKENKAVSDVPVKYFDNENDLDLYYNSGFLAIANKLSIPEAILNKAKDLYIA